VWVIRTQIHALLTAREGARSERANGEIGGSANAPIDIEAVVRALDQLASRDQLELAPFAGPWHPRVTELCAIENGLLATTLNAILQRLYKVLWVTDATKTEYLDPLRGVLDKCGKLTITTLNFDNVVELFAQTHEIPIQTGVGKAYDPRRGYQFNFEASGLNLIKLHGSLNWVLHDWLKEGAATHLVPHRFVVSHGSPFDGAMLRARPAILFGGDKLTTEGPYLELLQYFQAALAEAGILTVVGYSFRDDHVNAQIARFLNRSTAPQVNVIDPHPPNSEFLKVLRHHCSDRVRIVEDTVQTALPLVIANSPALNT